MKFVSFFSAFVLGVVFLFSAQNCSANQSPAESLNLICRAIIYADDSDLKKLGTSAENLRASYVKGFSETSSDVKFSAEQSERMTDALFNVLKNKVKFSVKTLSKEENKAGVEVTVIGVNISQTLKDFSFATNKENLTQEELAELVTNEIIKRLEDTVQLTPVTLNFDCEYDSKVDFWIPKGEGNILNSISDAALGKNYN